ncbi:MAG: hypothetical protein AB1721_02365 [Patescibacteria group bacterium]
MPYQHKELASGGWQKFSLTEQLANIGAEVGRAARWQDKDLKIFQGAVFRALELFDLTLADERWRGRRREIARLRELFLYAVEKDNLYQTSLLDMEKYFLPFMFLTRKKL